MDISASTSGAVVTGSQDAAPLPVPDLPVPDPFGRTIVAVFCAVPENLDLYERSIPWLSPGEQARAARFRFDRQRCVYVAAHLLLRCCLRQATGRADWDFHISALGKPALAEPVNGIPLHFNLTHTAGLAACALAYHHEVGIDAEGLLRKGDHLELARHFFAPEEVDLLTRLPASSREGAFLTIWTAKEAVIKAIGQGLQMSLAAFKVDISPPRVTFGNDCLEDAGRWLLHCHRLADHHLALAVRAAPHIAPPEHVNWRQVAWSDLLGATASTDRYERR